MKLDNKEFKRFKELRAKKKLSPEEEVELQQLTAKKNEKGSNKVEWWKNYPELAKNVSAIPFNYIPGTPLVVDTFDVRLATVLVVKYLSTIGRSRNTGDAFNSQVRQLWLDMHRKYRGMGGYQRADLAMMLLAIQSLFTTLAKFERLYTVINSYKVANRSVPYGLFEALGISNSLIANMASFRAELNIRIAKLQQLCLPKGIAAFEADITQALGIYKDSENIRASIFCFDPEYFGVYDPTAVGSGGVVKYQKFEYANMNALTPSGNEPAFNLGDITKVLDTQINALLGDDDVAKMCSDLIAAYGPENVMTVGYIPENIGVEIIHDYERKLQLHNTTFSGNVSTVFDANVSSTQVSALYTAGYEVIVYQYDDIVRNELVSMGEGARNGQIVTDGGYHWVGDTTAHYYHAPVECLFDTFVDEPGDVEKMCGTRFITLESSTYSHSSGGTTVYSNELSSFGTNVATTATWFAFNAATGTFVKDKAISGSVINSANIPVSTFQDLLNFDWAPLLYVYDAGDAKLHIFGDLDNFTKITEGIISKIHDVAIYSAYKIPNVSYIE